MKDNTVSEVENQDISTTIAGRGASTGAPYLLTVDDLDILPDPTWQIDGILPQGGVGLLYGEPSVGKSFVALDLALAVATGRTWQDRAVEPGDVVYIAAEGRSGLKKRVAAWQERHGVKASRALFRVQPCNILKDADRNQLIRHVKAAKHSPKFIVIDTLARCFGDGDENSTQAMNAFVAGLDQLRAAFPNAAVLVVHHSGKDRARRDRGNSALRGAVDVVMRLENKSGLRSLSCEKMKDAEPFGPIALRLEQVRLRSGDTSCVVTTAKADPQADDVPRRSNPNDNLALNALVVDEAAGGVWRGDEGLPFNEWWKATKLKKGTFGDAVARLQGATRVRRDGDRYVAVQ